LALTALPRIAIVGGGIAGLAAAFRLTRLDPSLRITVIEAESRLGGKVKTDKIDGYTIEGGPDSFLSYKPRGIGLCRELGIEDHLQGVTESTRRSFVLRHGKLYDLPEGLTGLIPTKLGPMAKTRLISPIGKLRMAVDYALPAKKGIDDESLAAFIERRLGREVYENLVEPLMAGIYAGDGRQLSLAATFPQLRQGELDHGGLIKGVLAERRNAPQADTPRPSPFLSPIDGMGAIVAALEEHLRANNVEIIVNRKVERLSRDGYFQLQTAGRTDFTADAVVLATPAHVSAALLRDLLPVASSKLDEIPHVSTATVALGFDSAKLDRQLDGHGYVIPRIEGRQALACTWVSSKWEHRAPQGKAQLRVFIGRAGQENVLERDDAGLIEIAREEIQQTLGISSTPELTLVNRWQKGMPQYTLGHLDRIAAIEREIQSIPALALAGNAFRGVGIPDCIASGDTAAESVVRSLEPIGDTGQISRLLADFRE
jgi:protoporphyrinogen/coproporphyrinogen III oxidase